VQLNIRKVFLMVCTLSEYATVVVVYITVQDFCAESKSAKYVKDF
jgi:hypothetical protein